MVAVEQLPDGIWQLGLDDGESVKSKIVVNAAGPWSGAFNKLSNVGSDFKVSVRPLRQEVHHVTAPTGYNEHEILGPMIADLDAA